MVTAIEFSSVHICIGAVHPLIAKCIDVVVWVLLMSSIFQSNALIALPLCDHVGNSAKQRGGFVFGYCR